MLVTLLFSNVLLLVQIRSSTKRNWTKSTCANLMPYLSFWHMSLDIIRRHLFTFTFIPLLVIVISHFLDLDWLMLGLGCLEGWILVYWCLVRSIQVWWSFLRSLVLWWYSTMGICVGVYSCWIEYLMEGLGGHSRRGRMVRTTCGSSISSLWSGICIINSSLYIDHSTIHNRHTTLNG